MQIPIYSRFRFGPITDQAPNVKKKGEEKLKGGDKGFLTVAKLFFSTPLRGFRLACGERSTFPRCARQFLVFLELYWCTRIKNECFIKPAI